MTDRIETILILENIRSVFNVGAIFRTADALGISKIYLAGITPTPLDRFGRERKDFQKTALGAEKSVRWKQIPAAEELIVDLKENDFQVVAVEQSSQSIDYKMVEIKNKTALIFGSETDGISKETLNLCDKIIEIPMKGKKESLNVAVSAGIVLYRLLDKFC